MTGNIVVGHGGGISLASPSASAPPGPDPETASAVVSGAGTATSNGTYERTGEQNGKAYYVSGGNEIVWSGADWRINDGALESISYGSSDDVAYPWLATWSASDGNPPAPTVEAG
jgi:hypothetical protein